jgi:hypothetical protein
MRELLLFWRHRFKGHKGISKFMACKRKHSKYSSIISSNYVFQGLAFETLGPWCKEAIDFINVIGNRLIVESKSKKFLFERISLAIKRGNAASIRDTFPDSALLSEIFVLLCFYIMFCVNVKELPHDMT